MSLINSSYFTGLKSIPNTNYPDVSSTLENLISVREKEYLITVLGYELFVLFSEGLLIVAPEQRFLDLLFGKDFVNRNGNSIRWNGFISITTEAPFVTISLQTGKDLFFTVGLANAPADGVDTYQNAALVGANYRVLQRGFGPLEILKSDNSNSATADIEKIPSGGFKWRNGILFQGGDTYNVQLLSADVTTSGVPLVPYARSPIADYVYFYWMRNNVTQTAIVGEVSSDNQNSHNVSPANKMVSAWNDMVVENKILAEYLSANSVIYPEYGKHHNLRKLCYLHTTINAYGI